MASTVNLKALGLNYQPNLLDVPPGSLVEAKNVIIRRDNVIESRRGFKLYGNSFGSGTDRAKQLMSYKNRILRHYTSKIQFDNGSGIFNDISGDYLETNTGLRIKSLERNGNLYFTTSDGIKKLSVKNASDLDTSISATNAGGIRAIDFEAELQVAQGDQASFFTQDSVVGYRHVWGTKDANGNLILGTPSPKIDIYNPLNQLIALDFNTLLSRIDQMAFSTTIGTTMISDTDYASSLSVASNPTGSELRASIYSLANKLDSDIVYTSGGLTTVSAEVPTDQSIVITFSADVDTMIQVGDRIFVSGFTDPDLVQLNNLYFTITGFNSSTELTAVLFQEFDETEIDLTVVTTTADVNGIVRSANYLRVISTPSLLAIDPTLPIPDPVTEPTTNRDLLSIQFALLQILTRLQVELPAVIADSLKAAYIDEFGLTTTAKVKLIINIPESITSDYFLQVYRSDVRQALDVTVLNELTADDEMRLVYEVYPTSTELTNGTMSFVDIVPPGFEGANLYTNAFTGEGIQQANFPPPYAKDINGFKGHVFYANTKKSQELLLTFLGVSSLYYSGTLLNIPTGAGPTYTITVDTTEGLANGDEIVILGSDSVPSIDGKRTISNVTSTSFDITYNDVITTGGILGTWFKDKGTNFSIVQGNVVENYSFVLNSPQLVKVTCPNGATFENAGTADYFIIYDGNNQNAYKVWFYVSDGTVTEPIVADTISLKIVITTTMTDDEVAQRVTNGLNSYIASFYATSDSSNIVTVQNIVPGVSNAPDLNTFPGSIAVDAAGDGEDAANFQIGLSTSLSSAVAINETTQSMVRVINGRPNGIAYAYYEFDPLSTFSGKFTLEERIRSDNPFYVIGNNDEIGSAFNPDISPEFSGITSTAGNPTIITWPSHGLITGDKVVITNADVSDINGEWTITYISANTFSIPVITMVSATEGNISYDLNAVYSSNVEAKNRVYFSKLNQPEAVPLINYIDIGPADKAILRIFPLRDSLFVYKEDGLYRISGEIAPFSQALFDSACILAAPDTVDTANNLIYCWTTQGISTTSEAGVNIISRAIDTEILKLASNNYPTFKTATWGIGYESDNSYTAFTIRKNNDTIAQVGYRYSNVTDTWTTIELSTTCGLNNPEDDRLYLGAGDTNFISQERKTFTRYDYADREIEKLIQENNYSISNVNGYPTGFLKQIGINDYVVGDVIVQYQNITGYQFNGLLEKLDSDPGIVNFGTPNYLETLEIFSGQNLRIQLAALAAKLDSDNLGHNNYFSSINSYSGTIASSSIALNTVITTTNPHNLFTGRKVLISGHTGSNPDINGEYVVTVLSPTTFSIPVEVKIGGTGGSFTTLVQDFTDIHACFTEIVTMLNTDSVVVFTNYSSPNFITEQEAVILEVDKVKKQLTLSDPLFYLEGEFLLYKAIPCHFQYAPEVMGDPLGLKHISEMTIMFANKAFTRAVSSFSTDLIPEFSEVSFRGDGSGAFGVSGEFGYNTFGGGSTSAPFRTYIPRQHQRCRFLNIRFTHQVAREQFAIFGATLTGEIGLSSRAYR